MGDEKLRAHLERMHDHLRAWAVNERLGLTDGARSANATWLLNECRAALAAVPDENARKALAKLSAAFGNPTLEGGPTLEEALVDYVIERYNRLAEAHNWDTEDEHQ